MRLEYANPSDVADFFMSGGSHVFRLIFSEFNETVGAFRIVLAPDDGSAPDAFEAGNWIEARDLVDTQHLRHVPKHGRFLKS